MDDENNGDPPIETFDISDDQYLAALAALLTEWSSPADAEAYDDL